MKKVTFLLAAVMCMLLSVNASAQDCKPLEVGVAVSYNQPLHTVEDAICVTIYVDFGNGIICPKVYTWNPINDQVAGSFKVLFTFTEDDPCMGGQCPMKEDVVSITVVVDACDDVPVNAVTVYEYRSLIYINYW